MRGSAGTRKTWGGSLIVGLLLLAAPATPAGTNWWPFYVESEEGPEEAREVEILGPLFSLRQTATEREWALHPLFRLRTQPDEDAERREVLYPLASLTRRGEDREWQVLQLLSSRNDESSTTIRERRFDLFPFFLSGRTEEGERYWGLFPLYGHVRDRLSFDVLDFALFPLYARTEKLGVETTHAPFPLVSWKRGEGVSGFRLWPLYGREEKAGVFEKRFVLWPFYFRQRLDLDTDDPQDIVAFWPFYYAQRSPSRDSTVVLWPFFGYTEDRKEHFTLWDAPWPLIAFGRGDNRRVIRILPFYAEEEKRLVRSFTIREMIFHDQAILWPLYTRSEEIFPDGFQARTRVVFFLYSDFREAGLRGEARRTFVWPLLGYRRERDGSVRFHALALLEPLLPDNEGIDRNWGPLWRVVSYRRDPEGRRDTSILWGLFRRQATPERLVVDLLGPLFRYRRQAGEGVSVTLLHGLLGYEVEEGRPALRLLFVRIPLGGGAETPAVAAGPGGGG